jgi:homocysteine S-methyltransferase
MARYRDALPQLADQMFLTDSGLETDLIFHRGMDLSCFAAFPLLEDPLGREVLGRYYRDHAAVAVAHRTGFVFEAPTWRANADWGSELGYGTDTLRAMNQLAVELMVELRSEAASNGAPVVISGCLGPRADGYHPRTHMSAPVSRAYHRSQIDAFSETDADMVSALTLTYPAEAIGIVQAAGDAGMPVAVSFTVETDGRLPDRTPLADAVRVTDDATGAAAAYFMVNCAHPAHIEPALDFGADWMQRVRGIRANASRRSHAELDNSADLDDGDPDELASDYQRLRNLAPSLTVLGGCCGTDLRHVQAIAAACAPI